MFKKIIAFSLENKLLIGLGVIALIILGLYSATKIPLDAVPDITNNQVQVVSTAPTFAPEEMEQLVTYPLEAAMTNLPRVVEVRSISRYGLSVITVVFEEGLDQMRARQYVQEQLNMATAELPPSVEPELMPITTGLGEIYQYVLTVEDEYAHLYNATKLRTIQDWIVKRQLNGTKGIIEISSFGGYLKQYEVAVQPDLLKTYGLSLQDVITALENNNSNSGGSYIEKEAYSFYIRTEGRVNDMQEIGNIPLAYNSGVPLRIKDVAEVRIGSAKRYGAMTMDGQGEVVGGITLMLKGANSSEALENVKERIAKIQRSLPEGVNIYPYLDRSKLIGSTINTASTNLIEGGLIVILVLLLLLGNFRAGLIVASVIPLSMLFALIMMRLFDVSANLMSLGAIDFGIVIDGAVIIVEALMHTLVLAYVGKQLSQSEMDGVVKESAAKIYRSAAFGVLIILVVFLPILTLEGTEGKTFRPMAQTVSFAIIGSLILSLTYVPVAASLFLKKKISQENKLSKTIIEVLKQMYLPVLNLALKRPWATVLAGIVAFALSIALFNRLGAEFIPTLEEGDIAMQQSIKPGSSLQESIHTSTMAEKILLDNFPEVEHVVSKIGTAEVPTDPMAIEDADIMIILKDKEEWSSASDREELMNKMKVKLAPISWASFEFTQPIQLRFNELMTGAKADISVKIFGEDVGTLKAKADEAAGMIRQIPGAGDVKVDQTDGLQQLSVQYNRDRMAQFGINVEDVNQVIRAAYAGEQAGAVYEEERKFDLVVRLAPEYRQELNLRQLTIATYDGQQIPLSEVAAVQQKESPMMISREQARRFINIGVNVRNRDVASLVEAIQTQLDEELELPPGYEIQYGGQFENLVHARNRLLIAVPIALALIMLFLFFAFGSMKDVLIIFMAVPLSAIGGILTLQLRDMPFSISSGIGFIALFGISVLNGIVLISAIKQLDLEKFNDFRSMIRYAALTRLRPVLMTALVAAFGFLPMALSTGNGAEVQRPLASVVIGGLITSTLLTLVILPALYYLVYKGQWKVKSAAMVLLLLGVPFLGQSQELNDIESLYKYSKANHPLIENRTLAVQQEALSKDAIGQWAPLEFNYQGGQINYGGYDHFIQIQQSASHLFLQKQQADLVDARIKERQNESRLFGEELRYQLSITYDEWAYWQARSQLADSVLQLYDALSPKVELRYQAGEITPLEVNLFQSEHTRAQQDTRYSKQQARESEARLRSTAYVPDSIPIDVPELSMKSTIILDSIIGQHPQLQALQLARERLNQEIELNGKQSKRPELSLGYFAQSLEKDFSFQGVLLNIGIPLDRRVAKTQNQQLLVQQQRLQNEQQHLKQQFMQRVVALQSTMASVRASIATYETLLDNRLDIALQQLEQGEIDLFRFTQIQEKLLDNRRAYLDELRRYNQSANELYYLTQTTN